MADRVPEPDLTPHLPLSVGAPIDVAGFTLAPWQEDAVAAWCSGSAGRPYHGTIEVFTGGGKTLLALTGIARVSAEIPDLHVAVVVPTVALAQQWVDAFVQYTHVPEHDVGVLGAGRKASFGRHRVIVAVINGAAKRLPEMAADAQPLMLVIDECHRAGAPSFSRVLTTPSRYRMGLSTTPDREEFDDEGEPLEFDEQVVGRALGPVVFRFGLREAREVGWLPSYTIHHHGVQLIDDERKEYEEFSRRVDDLADRLREQGVAPERARSARRVAADARPTVDAYIAATAARKDLLYRAAERSRVVERLVRETADGSRTPKTLLFHERRVEAENLAERLRTAMPDVHVELEHARLPPRQRRAALASFRSGAARVLVSVKALIEGIDVPDAEVGVSVASSSAVRQRIQALGRVLRRRFDDAPKHADMHVLYVADTVDDFIYAREDWSDLTGEANNRYYLWPLAVDEVPETRDGPPRSPRPSEEQEVERLAAAGWELPTEWSGLAIGQEYSVDALGNVRNHFGTVITNPQGVGAMLNAARGRPGGKFRVTPGHRVVLAWRREGEESTLQAIGRLSEAFLASADEDAANPDEAPDSSLLVGGEPYPGSIDESNGRYKISKAQGGRIVHEAGRGTKLFALTTDGGDAVLESNASRVLDAWRSSSVGAGVEIRINRHWDCIYLQDGQARFLARVPGGFAWPTEVTS